ASIARAVMRGLEKERSKRFPTLAALVHELAPPPQRTPTRYVALAAVGALAVTAATAAVLVQRDDTIRIEPAENHAVKVLVDEIHRKDKEIEALKDELVRRARDREEIEILRKRLEEAQEESRQLLDQLVELKK